MGLEHSDTKILFILSRTEDYVNKRQLAKLANLNENTVHASITRLEKMKLVSRKRGPLRSANRIKINPSGVVVAELVVNININEKKIVDFLNKVILVDVLEKYR